MLTLDRRSVPSSLPQPPNPSLSSAIFRPILDSDGEQSLVYYVPETAEADEAALRGMRLDQPALDEVSYPLRWPFGRLTDTPTLLLCPFSLFFS